MIKVETLPGQIPTIVVSCDWHQLDGVVRSSCIAGRVTHAWNILEAAVQTKNWMEQEGWSLPKSLMETVPCYCPKHKDAA